MYILGEREADLVSPREMGTDIPGQDLEVSLPLCVPDPASRGHYLQCGPV